MDTLFAPEKSCLKVSKKGSWEDRRFSLESEALKSSVKTSKTTRNEKIQMDTQHNDAIFEARHAFWKKTLFCQYPFVKFQGRM